MELYEIPSLPRGVRIQFDRVRENWVLLAPERALTLDPVGHAILQEIDGQRTLGDITSALAQKYDAPQVQIQKDGAGFLNALRNRRLLDVAP